MDRKIPYCSLLSKTNLYAYHILSGHALRLQQRLEMSTDQMQHESAVAIGRPLLSRRGASVREDRKKTC